MTSGESSERTSGSETHKPGAPTGSKSRSSLSLAKEFIRRLAEPECLTEKLLDWFPSISEYSNNKRIVPFELQELQKFDYALEGVSFQQLIRMPNAVYASTSDAVEAKAYLALEDFLYAAAKGLWETFWDKDGPMPFLVGSLHSSTSRFYPAEKVIANGKAGGLCATALLVNNGRHSYGKWEEILEVALLRSDVASLSSKSDRQPSPSVLGEALFFAVRVLLSRNLSRYNLLCDSNFVYVLIVDSQYGGVVKLEGDVRTMEVDVNNVYECAADWIINHSRVMVSSVDRIWNKLGNANWGDVGTLQVLHATYHTIMLTTGTPKKTFADLAGIHVSRLQKRRNERQLVEIRVNGSSSTSAPPLQQSYSSEIVEVRDELVEVEPQVSFSLEVGSILWMEDSNWKKGFQINEALRSDDVPIYSSTSLDEPGKLLLLYVGSHPSRLGPSWEEMNLWYQVQRQTKILTVMRQKGLSSKYLPQLVASGRIVHPGQCSKSGTNDRCNHPWCGTPILAMYPVGEFVSSMVKRVELTPEEVLRLSHDCLSAIHAASTAGIRHGDICPENIICVSSGAKCHFVLVGWGRAVLEDKDKTATNLHYSSSYALQEGKLCPSSDAESLVYLLFFLCGGLLPELDSVEAALQWRESAWSKRLIQQKLGHISTVLKAFADYIDSLCGTPYPVDYEIWLRRLSRSLQVESHGKEVLQMNGRAESSGATASASFS
ncbi:uncharacterized protein LOC116254677 [Nymphaea colorata]|nr:uncharacterized protein LOC116254677 [Nymphaea colorata]XP_031486085.1 uncharacterized protein LOC116254677 [Nymphaea colorata]